MPPAAPPAHPTSPDRSVPIAVLFVAAVLAVFGLYKIGFFTFLSGAGQVELVSAHAAATYRASGLGLSAIATGITTVGPITGTGRYTAVATLALPPALTKAEAASTGAIWPPVIIAAPEPVWSMTAGGTSAGSGRPLGVGKDGRVLALTPSGLVALSVSGSTTLVGAEAADLVGALSPNSTLVAIKNPATRMIDLYALGAGDAAYKGSITLYDPIAVAFASNTRLVLLTADGIVSSYAVTTGQSPTFIATSTLPNKWP